MALTMMAANFVTVVAREKKVRSAWCLEFVIKVATDSKSLYVGLLNNKNNV